MISLPFLVMMSKLLEAPELGFSIPDIDIEKGVFYGMVEVIGIINFPYFL